MIYLIAIFTYFVQGISSLPNLAFTGYMKDVLHYDEQKVMYIGSLIGVAWIIKPFWGAIIDFFNLSVKKVIIPTLIISIITILCINITNNFLLIIILMSILSITSALRDVSVDGFSCVLGKRYSITGKIQALQWIAITVASILTGLGGGYIADHYSYKTAYLLLVPILIAMIVVVWFYQEDKEEIQKLSFIASMKQIFMDKNMLLVCAAIFLYNFSPSIGTPLFYIMRDKFHWTMTQVGLLGTVGSVTSIAGAWLYYHYSKKLDLRKWLYRGIWISSVSTLGYLYFTPISCIVYSLLFSVSGMFITLLLLDFMARETKPGSEALSFALLCSVSNLAGTCNGLVGGFLLPIVGLQTLIVISAFTSFLCIPIIRRLKI